MNIIKEYGLQLYLDSRKIIINDIDFNDDEKTYTSSDLSYNAKSHLIPLLIKHIIVLYNDGIDSSDFYTKFLQAVAGLYTARGDMDHQDAMVELRSASMQLFENYFEWYIDLAVLEVKEEITQVNLVENGSHLDNMTEYGVTKYGEL